MLDNFLLADKYNYNRGMDVRNLPTNIGKFFNNLNGVKNLPNNVNISAGYYKEDVDCFENLVRLNIGDRITFALKHDELPNENTLITVVKQVKKEAAMLAKKALQMQVQTPQNIVTTQVKQNKFATFFEKIVKVIKRF